MERERERGGEMETATDSDDIGTKENVDLLQTYCISSKDVRSGFQYWFLFKHVMQCYLIICNGM